MINKHKKKERKEEKAERNSHVYKSVQKLQIIYITKNRFKALK